MIEPGFWKDYQKVKETLDNSKNEKKHSLGLYNLVKALDRKWCYNDYVGLYRINICTIVDTLYDQLKMKLK